MRDWTQQAEGGVPAGGLLWVRAQLRGRGVRPEGFHVHQDIHTGSLSCPAGTGTSNAPVGVLAVVGSESLRWRRRKLKIGEVTLVQARIRDGATGAGDQRRMLASRSAAGPAAGSGEGTDNPSACPEDAPPGTEDTQPPLPHPVAGVRGFPCPRLTREI